MEDEIRMQRLELKVNNQGHKLDSHDEHIEKVGKDIAMLQKILTETQTTNRLIGEVIDYARKTYEVFEPMAKFLSMVAKVSIIFTVVWHAVKWAAIKLGFLA